MDEQRAQLRQGLAELEAEMRAWSQAHPQATLDQIERELDGRLRTIRAAVLSEVAGASAADLGMCPDCGVRLVSRGPRERRLRTDGEQSIHLRRTYASCPVCGRGLFPPG